MVAIFQDIDYECWAKLNNGLQACQLVGFSAYLLEGLFACRLREQGIKLLEKECVNKRRC